jgi:uncharacterized membrane protein required for colicin V production
MKNDAIPLNWVDVLTAIVLIVGIIRGRKRGMSEEFLDTMQWLAIVVVGGLFYRHLAANLTQPSLMGAAALNVAAYILIALVIKLVVTFLKRRAGEKVMGSDLFGRFEYYLGMAAGALRYGCIYLFLLNLLHAPYYTKEMLAATEQSQEKNFGDVRFPTLGALQFTVYRESATGWLLENGLEPILIQPASAKPSDLRNENSMAARRENLVNEIMTKH